MNLVYEPKQYVRINIQELTDKERFINFDGSLCQAGQYPLGIAEKDHYPSEFAQIITLGTAFVEAKTDFKKADKVYSGDEGYAVNYGIDPIGRALNDCQAGDLVKVLLRG